MKTLVRNGQNIIQHYRFILFLVIFSITANFTLPSSKNSNKSRFLSNSTTINSYQITDKTAKSTPKLLFTFNTSPKPLFTLTLNSRIPVIGINPIEINLENSTVFRDQLPLKIDPKQMRRDYKYIEHIRKFNSELTLLRAIDILYYNKKFAQKYDIDLSLLFAIQQKESNFRPYALSSAGAIGICQVMYGFAVKIAKIYNIPLNKKWELFELDKNIEIASAIIHHLFEKYSHFKNRNYKYKVIFADYNGGHHQAKRFRLKQQLYTETRQYIHRTFKIYQKYLTIN